MDTKKIVTQSLRGNKWRILLKLHANKTRLCDLSKQMLPHRARAYAYAFTFKSINDLMEFGLVVKTKEAGGTYLSLSNRGKELLSIVDNLEREWN